MSTGLSVMDKVVKMPRPHWPGLTASHQCKITLISFHFLMQGNFFVHTWFLQFHCEDLFFQGWFICGLELCLRDGLKQKQGLNGYASGLLQLQLCFVYRPLAAPWWMGREWSTTFSTTTSWTGIGPWGLQSQVAIKWSIVNASCDGFSGKTRQRYFNSISFQNGNFIISEILFPVKVSCS